MLIFINNHVIIRTKIILLMEGLNLRKVIPVLMCVLVVTLQNNPVLVKAQPITFEEVNSLQFPKRISHMEIWGSYAFIHVSDFIERIATLYIYNISDIHNWTKLTQLDIPSNGRSLCDIVVAGTTCYLLSVTQDLFVLDISNITHPITLAQFSYDSSDFSEQMIKLGSYLYIADAARGLVAVDVRDPNNIQIAEDYFTGGNVVEIKNRGNLLYVLDYLKGLYIFNISTVGNFLTDLIQVNYYQMNTLPFKMFLKDNYIYTVGMDSGLTILDITDPTQITEVNFYEYNDLIDTAVSTGTLIFSLTRSHGMTIFDVSDPTNIYRIGQYGEPIRYSGLEMKDSIVFLDETLEGALNTSRDETALLKILEVSVDYEKLNQSKLKNTTTPNSYGSDSLHPTTEMFTRNSSLELPPILFNVFFWILCFELVVLVAVLHKKRKINDKTKD